ncbi:MAG: polysaccharide biosynthesis protein [Clostridia bacterium]|nr:polysaccharide biosynthesis protein [Clostridia bacterium]
MSLKTSKFNKTTSQSFLKGALVLTVSMLLVKACGLLQKVLLTNLYSIMGESYGEFGSGLFANAYELYVPLFTLATIGFPVAISRMVSEANAKGRYKDVVRVYKVAMPMFVIMGAVCFLLMVAGGFIYVRYIDSPYSLYGILMLAPTIFFGCLVSVYRGYFEGLRNMRPTALSEIIEALSKIAIGVAASYLVINKGVTEYSLNGTVFGLSFQSEDEAYCTLLSFSVAASIFGITMGSFISFLYMKIRFSKGKGDIPEILLLNSPEAVSKSEIFRNMLKVAMPVGVGALVMSFANSLDATILNRVLKGMATDSPDELVLRYPELQKEIYVSNTAHTCIWGYYSSCLTILSIVSAITQVFGTSAMPNVTNAYTKGDKQELKKSIETVIRLSAVFSLPCGIGLAVLAEPILSLVYFSNPNIPAYGAPVLQIMGIASVFIGICTPVCAMLQGVGKAKVTMFIYVFGTIIKVIVSYLFARNINVNISGTAIGSLVSNFLMCIVASVLLIKFTKVWLDFISVIIKPFIASAVCGGFAYLCYYQFDLNVLISVVISAIIYFVILFMLHTFSKDEIKMVLNCKKIVIILEKLHLIV